MERKAIQKIEFIIFVNGILRGINFQKRMNKVSHSPLHPHKPQMTLDAQMAHKTHSTQEAQALD